MTAAELLAKLRAVRTIERENSDGDTIFYKKVPELSDAEGVSLLDAWRFAAVRTELVKCIPPDYVLLPKAALGGSKFQFGDYVRKLSGSDWSGRVCGFYTTNLTVEGYCVESVHHAGSVQIYPARALEAIK